MRVVVLFVGSGSGELDRSRSLLEVSDQVPLEELGAVITIEAKDGKGQRGFDGDQLFQDATLAFAPDRALFSPAGGDIGNVEGEDERPGHGVIAVSHGIGLKEPGPRLIPLVGFDGDVVLEERARLGGGEAFALNAKSFLGEEAVNGRGGDVRQGLSDAGRQNAEGLLIRLDPAVQDGPEALGTGIVGGLPDAAQHGQDLGLVVA